MICRRLSAFRVPGDPLSDHPMLMIRIAAERRRTFHTHGIPFRTERVHGWGMVEVPTWSRSRGILNRTYRDMRAFGLTAGQARHIVADMLLVPR